MYLPRHHGDVEQRAPSSSEIEPSKIERGELVLVVDDEPAVRAFSVDALTELGYRTVEADGAENALRALEVNPGVDLLFTDIVMPDVNGRKLAEEARRRCPKLKVLFTTGYTRDGLSEHGAREQGTELISKPFSIEDLAAKVRTVLDG
jgi:CheY-like chemotaxis protein